MIEFLNAAVRHAKKSPFYSKKLDGVTGVSSLDQFASLPFTTKQDLRDNYPYGTLAVNLDEVVEVHTSSGTTGKPTVSFMTKEDLRVGSEHISRAWKNFGVTPASRVQFMMGYGLFSGAALNSYAIQQVGGFVIPSGIQATKKQVELLRDFKVDTMVATPSYYLWLYNYLRDTNIDPSELNLTTGIAAGEVYGDDLKQKISDLLGIRIFDHYGLCEVNTGIIYECRDCGRMAVLKDYVYAEVINPKSGELAQLGEYGELVLTATMKQASPIIRYRTGDCLAMLEKSSACLGCYGSTIVSRVRGRIDDTIFYRGLLLSPHEIRDFIVLESEESLAHRMKIVVRRNDDMIVENIRVKLALPSTHVSVSKITELEHKLHIETKAPIKVEAVTDDYFAGQTTTKTTLVEYV